MQTLTNGCIVSQEHRSLRPAHLNVGRRSGHPMGLINAPHEKAITVYIKITYRTIQPAPSRSFSAARQWAHAIRVNARRSGKIDAAVWCTLTESGRGWHGNAARVEKWQRVAASPVLLIHFFAQATST
jgi:hypothetical protein